MREKVKEWIKEDFKSTRKNTHSNTIAMMKSLDRCYGVIQFACNVLCKEYDEELARWWDDEMRPKFYKYEEDQIKNDY